MLYHTQNKYKVEVEYVNETEKYHLINNYSFLFLLHKEIALNKITMIYKSHKIISRKKFFSY